MKYAKTFYGDDERLSAQAFLAREKAEIVPGNLTNTYALWRLPDGSLWHENNLPDGSYSLQLDQKTL